VPQTQGFGKCERARHVEVSRGSFPSPAS
jgi:hypothetical protein